MKKITRFSTIVNCCRTIFCTIAALLILTQGSFSQSGLLIYEGFNYSSGSANGVSGGAGWGAGSAWNGDFNIVNTSAMSFANLSTTGNYLSGANWSVFNRRIKDISTSFPSFYDNTGFERFNKGTIYTSVLIRVNAFDGDEPVGFELTNNNADGWSGADRKIGTAYYGADSKTGSDRFWTLRCNDNFVKSNIQVVLGETVLLVMKVEFGTSTKLSMYVNPTPGGAEPVIADASYEEITNLAEFVSATLYFGNNSNSNRGNLDELRIGTTFASVTPTTAPIVSLSGININGGSNTITSPGGSLELSTSTLPTTATSPVNISWSVSNASLATLSGVNGSVVSITGLLNGIVTVTATAVNPGNSVSNSYIITLSNQTSLVSLTGVSVNGGSSITSAGGQLELTAAPVPGNATAPVSYTWSVSSASKVKLSTVTGQVVTLTGNINGIVTVTCYASNAGSNATGVKVINISGQPAPASFVYASEVPDIYSKVGDIRLNQHVYGGDPGFTVAGVYYPKGIGFATDNALTATTYNLNGGYKKFTALAVNQADCGGGSKVGLSILVDGNEVFRNNAISVSNSDNIDIDLTGASAMEIKINDGGDGPCADWGALADAKLYILYPAENITIAPVGNVTSVAGNGSLTSFTGIVSPSYAEQSIIWSVISSPSVTASINSITGEFLVENNENGFATVVGTALYPTSVAGTYVINVKQIPVTATGIAIEGVSTGEINVDESAVLTVSYTPLSTNRFGVNWSSSNTSIATVNNGTVSGIVTGIVTITATYGLDASILAVTVVRIVVPVRGITISGFNSILVQEVTTLTSTIDPVVPTNSALLWASSNTNIATVANEGVVTGVSVGVVTITATSISNPLVSVGYVLSVNPVLVANISLSGPNVVEGTGTVSAIILPATASDKTLTWESSDNTIATISGLGEVTAFADGIVTITAISVSNTNVTANYVLTIIGPKITLSSPASEITASKGTLQINASITGSTQSTVTYSVSNPEIAIINSSGLLTAKANGVVRIIAILNSNSTIKDSLSITISGQNTDLQASLDETISVYPNPVKDNINIICQSQIVSLELFDLSGNHIYKSSNTNTISLLGLVPGYYLLKIHSIEGVGYRRILKD